MVRRSAIRGTLFHFLDFGLGVACAQCTRDAKATISDQMVVWPCAVVEKAIADGP
ncbi:hypothetical protein ACWDA3_61635 [Nonomuraea rubra]